MLWAGIALVAACGSEAAAPATDLSGQWTIGMSTTGSAAGYGCSTTVTLTLGQTGSSLSGSYALAGTCTTPHDLREDAHAGVVTNGQVNGSTVRFHLGICQFEGSQAGDAGMNGTVTCSEPAEIPLPFSGTWSASRGANP